MSRWRAAARLERVVGRARHGLRADLHVRDHGGRTALHWAAIAGRAGSAALLIDAGARPDLLDATEASPIDYARNARHPERVREALKIAFRID